MKRFFKVILLLFVVAVILSFVGVEPLATYREASVMPRLDAVRKFFYSTDEEIMEGILVAINEERAKEDLHPLIRDPKLDALAMEHATFMGEVQEVNHIFYEDRVERSGHVHTGEVCAGSSHDAETIVGLWMKSPGHWAHITSEYYFRAGVGFAGGYACVFLTE